MNNVPKYVREQKRYSKKDLIEIFSLDNQSVISFIKRLKLAGALKQVKKNIEQKNSIDWLDEDVEIVNDEFENGSYLYIFTFVGVLTMGNHVILSFPKYLLTETEPFEEMKEIIKVLKKYDSKKNIAPSYSGFYEEKEFNLLSIYLYLINDYYENGIYTTPIDIIETNGEGEILWENTINDTLPLIVRNKPYYLELKTKNVDSNEQDYISRLHKCILTDCCKNLKESNLLDLFEIDDLHLSDENLENFGDNDYIIYKLNSELNVQFITRKQILLKTLRAYITHSKSFKENFGLSIFGTTSFHNVWEGVCASVFDNNLKIPLSKLKMPVSLHMGKKNENLLDIIDKPIWTYFGSQKINHKVKDSLKPDLISLYEVENGMCFGIFDAKYYNLLLDENNLKNAPGVYDITKQYLYQMAFNNFIEKHKFSHIANAFLIPSEEDYDDDAELIGEVKMNILEGLSTPPLINISVMKVSAKKVFRYYLKNKKINLRKLNVHKKIEYEN